MRPPLPGRLTPAEREFHIELRRLADAAGLSADDLADTAAGKASWERWLAGQSVPAHKALRELTARLAADGIGTAHLHDLRARAVLPAPYPAEPGRSPVRPRQLPPQTRDFMSRAEELKILDDLARPDQAPGGNATVIVIEGAAGTGKTALANHVAHLVRDRFPDGQLWASLRGFGDVDEPVTGTRALRGFLEALGIAHRNLPMDVEQRAALYRTLLSGRRILVVLDNARDADQVRLLLPDGPGCLALITTRAPSADFAGEGTRVLRLGPLSEGEARDLLEQHLGAVRLQDEPQAANEVSLLCGRLPLALTVAAARAAATPWLPLESLAGELRSRGLGGGAVPDHVGMARAALDVAYGHLSGDAARVFRLLGVCPGPDIGVPAAASLAAVPVERAGEALDELAALCLVEAPHPGRYAIHDLLHGYAASLGLMVDGAGELQAAMRRLLDHYLLGMRAAVPLILRAPLPVPPPRTADGVTAERFGSRAQALAWCRAERRDAQALVTYAARRGGFDVYCWQLPWVMAPLLARGGFFHDYLALQRIAVEAACNLGDPVAIGVANHEFAHACALLGDVSDSDAHLKEALRRFTEAGEQALAARTINGMAQLLMQDGEYARALEREQEALELRGAVGDLGEIAHSEETIGSIYARLGRYDEAVEHCQRSLDLSRDVGSRALAADAMATLGYVHLSRGDHARAVACYTEVLTIYRGTGDSLGTAHALAGLGDAQYARADVPAARAAWRQALAILSDLPNADLQPVTARLAQLGWGG